MEFKFDKFIDDIVKREAENAEKLKEAVTEKEELPQRVYNKLYRER